MIYDHRVKVNGKWFAAGVDVPTSAEPISKTSSEQKPKNKFNIPYSKAELQKMNKKELFEAAEKLGIKLPEGITYQEVKSKLIGALDM